MIEIIEEFMERYNKEVDFYANLSSMTEKNLRSLLNKAGVRCLVSSRAKDPKKLVDKLEVRNKNKNYSSVDAIFKDIADLSGVRVALYFPGDISLVDEVVKANFKVIEERNFPESKVNQQNHGYQKVFSGYKAKHYRVILLGDSRYSNKHNVEIQVASVLMHAWSEVEHDLVYKPLQGKISKDELMILDEINGLVLAGNLALERLQQAGLNRTSEEGYEFKNHFDVASFFTSKLNTDAAERINYIKIFKLLNIIGKLKRSNLLSIMEWIKDNTEIFSKKNSRRFAHKTESVTEFRKLMYAISAIFRDDVLNIINSEQLDFDEENDKDNRIKLTLTNSLITSLLIDPELRPVSLITNEFETNNDLLGYSEDESLEFALSSSNFKISGDKSHFLKALREYINSVEILHKDFTKKGFEEAIKLNRKASAFLKKE
ncbi:hypothetical protein [Pantoea ananatis]